MLNLSKDYSRNHSHIRLKKEDYFLRGAIKTINEKSFSIEDGKFGEIVKKYCSQNIQVSFNRMSQVLVENQYDELSKNIIFKNIFEYDDEKIEAITYKSTGEPIIKRIFFIDSKGKLQEYNQIRAKVLKLKLICRYDNFDRLIGEQFFYDSKEHNNEKFYKHHDEGSLITHTYSTSKTRTIYKIDDKGRKIEVRQFNNGVDLIDHYLYEYNNRGDVTQCISLNPNGSFSSKSCYKYVYDVYNNWIRKVELNSTEINDFPKANHLYEREISYY